jgi:8-oxo-dGTP pyrophosphatase MutT (NUDIX family)
MVWKPHVTVAAVIEQDNQFLLVKEYTKDGIRFNQPAGHLENNENLIEAIVREVYEETAGHFVPQSLIGLQLWQKHEIAPTFLRVCFQGRIDSFDENQPLDDEIISTHWLTLKEIQTLTSQLRSPLVLKSIQSYLSGETYPLTLLKSYLNLHHE